VLTKSCSFNICGKGRFESFRGRVLLLLPSGTLNTQCCGNPPARGEDGDPAIEAGGSIQPPKPPEVGEKLGWVLREVG
jgi:hypothetical protein